LIKIIEKQSKDSNRKERKAKTAEDAKKFKVRTLPIACIVVRALHLRGET